MASFLSELWLSICGHKPNSGFIEAAFGINVASAVYKPIFDRTIERIQIKYDSMAVTARKERNVTADDQQKINTHKGKLTSDLSEFGKSSIKIAQLIAFWASILCLLILYLDWMQCWMIFLPTTPVFFIIIVRLYAVWRYRTFLHQMKNFIEISCSPSEIKKEIAESITPSSG